MKRLRTVRVLLLSLVAGCSATHKAPLASEAAPPAMSEMADPERPMTGPGSIALPPVPPIARKGELVGPTPGTIGRNAAVADRFVQEGQSVEYAFECEAGELALFDLMTWGYARGWHSAMRVRMLDDAGRELATMTRSGPTAWRGFWTFTAPARGTYRCELRATDQCFRYRLVRYASYREREDVERVDAQSLVRGFLRSSSDRASYSIRLAEGEEVAFKVLNSDEPGRVERRKTTPPRPDNKNAILGWMYPSFRVEVALDGAPQAAKSHFVLFRAPRDGEYRVDVIAPDTEAGGLFDLSIERAPAKVEVHGVVLDRENTPLANVEVACFRMPDRDPVGSTITASDGSYSIALPPGPQRIRLTRAGGTQARDIDTNVLRARELNLVWTDARRPIDDDEAE